MTSKFVKSFFEVSLTIPINVKKKHILLENVLKIKFWKTTSKFAGWKTTSKMFKAVLLFHYYSGRGGVAGGIDNKANSARLG